MVLSVAASLSIIMTSSKYVLATLAERRPAIPAPMMVALVLGR